MHKQLKSDAEQRDLLLIFSDNIRQPEKSQNINSKPNADQPLPLKPPSIINQNSYQQNSQSQQQQQQQIGIILPQITTNRNTQRPLETHNQHVIIYSNSNINSNPNPNRYNTPSGGLQHQIQLYITRPKDEQPIFETNSSNSSTYYPLKLIEHKTMLNQMMNNSSSISHFAAGGGQMYEIPRPFASESHYGISSKAKRSPFSDNKLD